MDDALHDIVGVLAVVALAAALLGLLGLLLIHRRLRRLDVPPDADFATTLRLVPLSLVIVLDLLDLGLDILATPIVWLVLSRYRLQALRNVAAVEALVPLTGPLPVLTASWLVVRALRLGDTPIRGRRAGDPGVIEMEQDAPGKYVPQSGRR